MIKIVLALFAFAVLLCVWIVDPLALGGDTSTETAALALSGPGADRLGTAADGEVTRGVGLASLLPVPASLPVGDMARRTSAPVDGDTPASASADSALHGLRSFDAPMSDAVTAVLRGLGFDGAEPVPVAEPVEADPRDLQLANTLADIAAITGVRPPATPAPETPPDRAAALAAIVAEALRSGRTDADIDAEVNRAARDGDIAVPGVLIRADGGVDSTALLTGVLMAVRAAQGAAPDLAPLAGRVLVSDAVHTVAPQDSLAGLALAYYGTADAADTIRAANGDMAPDALAEGQEIVIPRL